MSVRLQPQRNDEVMREPELKVVAYIVRNGRMVAFLHEDDDDPVMESGLQVPAGTVERGESPEDAVVREAFEETGLQHLELVRKVGVDHPTWPDTRPQTRYFYELRAAEAPDEWRHVERHGRSRSRGRPFRLFWIPIAKAPLLAAGQGMFAARLLE